jgi:glycerate-2-kinase
MKQITQEEINAVMEVLFKLNAPIQAFNSVQKLLSELPDVDKKK